jgi:hypothetical protein
MFSNKKKTLLVAGASAGVAATIIFAALFSSTAASAQMMMQNNNNSNSNSTNNMMTTSGQSHYQGAHSMSMFSVMGMSMVRDVAVTGASVTGDSEITVNVRYTGNGTSTPGLGVFVMTNHMDMMKGHMMGGMMSGGQQYYDGGMGGGYGPMMMGGNNMMMTGSGMQQWNGTMTQDGMMASHGGSNFVKAGWAASGNTIKVKLDGASAYDARDIMVMVCPYLG